MTDSLLNLKALDDAVVSPEPYPHLVIDNFFNPNRLSDIIQQYPKIDQGGSFPPETFALTDLYKSLLTSLQGAELRKSIGQKFSLELADKPCVITFRGFSRAKDGKVHTDSKSKLVTLLLYVNESWPDESGQLRILNSDDVNDVHTEVLPTAGRAILFKVTDNCWHGYPSYEGQRQAIQLNYLVSEKAMGKHKTLHRWSAWIKRLFTQNKRADA